MDVKGDNEIEPVERAVVDCDRVDGIFGKGKKEEEVNEDWDRELMGGTAYHKLLEFRQNHLKRIKIVAQSKQW